MNVTSAGASAESITAMPTNPKAEMGKQEFLQLLVTQLRHQDPLNPSDAQEFAAQLAQFSSLEQLVNIGSELEAQQLAYQAMIELTNASSALGVLGRDVVATGDAVVVGEDGSVTVSFAAESAGTGTVEIFDVDTGDVVATVDIGSTVAGPQHVALDPEQLGLPSGNYRFAVAVTDAHGAEVGVNTLVTGRVEGVRYTPNGPLLTCGSMEIPLSAVIEVITTQQES